MSFFILFWRLAKNTTQQCFSSEVIGTGEGRSQFGTSAKADS